MRVMLVDDYPLILRGLMKTFDWEAEGFPVVSQAGNGKQALALLEEQPVDILITDIRMPVMDGLELIRQVTGLYPRVKIAVLSAYDDFEQVRTAFQLGADDYLLKQELNAQVIGTVLEKFRSALLIEDSRRVFRAEPSRERVLRAEAELREAAGAWTPAERQTAFLLQCIRSAEPPDRAQAERLGISVSSGLSALMQFVVETADTESGIDAEAAFFTFEQELFQLAARMENAYLFRTNYNEQNLLFPVPPGRTARSCAERLYEKLQSGPAGRLVVTGAVSGCGAALDDLRLLYSQARQAGSRRFLSGKGKLFFYEELPPLPDTDREARARCAFLRKSLQNRDFHGLLERLDTLMLSDGRGGLERLFTQYAWILVNEIEEQNLPVNCDKLLVTFHFLLSGGSVRELNRWLEETVRQLAALSESQNQYIQLFRAYIAAHYAEPGLKFEEVARSLGVSSGHLGKIIYRETGCHFADYLNAYRVERARELLASTTMKVYEVADHTGYNNVEHFTRVFKKLVGVSPTAYANRAL